MRANVSHVLPRSTRRHARRVTTPHSAAHDTTHSSYAPLERRHGRLSDGSSTSACAQLADLLVAFLLRGRRRRLHVRAQSAMRSGGACGGSTTTRSHTARHRAHAWVRVERPPHLDTWTHHCEVECTGAQHAFPHTRRAAEVRTRRPKLRTQHGGTTTHAHAGLGLVVVRASDRQRVRCCGKVSVARTANRGDAVDGTPVVAIN